MKQILTSVTTAFMCVLTIGLATGSVASAQEQSVDYSNEIHPVKFLPWGQRKIALRDANGKWLGYSAASVPFQINVNGNTFRDSIDPVTRQINIAKMLRQMDPHRGQDGKIYFTMNLLEPAKLDNGKTLQPGTVEKPNQVVIAAEDFTVALQPAEAGTVEQTAPAIAITEQWNTNLAQNGVTPETDPTTHEDTSNDTMLDKESNGDADDADDRDTTPGGFTVAIGDNLPLPPRFLSSPVCGCLGGSCSLSSQIGKRGHKDSHGKCHTQNGNLMSCNHQGIDLSTANHKVGTPVVAAAYGCFKVVKKNGLRAHRQGDPIAPRDLLESGYGFTVRMTHGNTMETQYSHLASVSPAVRWGMCVKRGQRIGTMGDTGRSSGPHLHFGVGKDHHIVNPMNYFDGEGSNGQITGRFLAQKCTGPIETEDDRKIIAAIQATSAAARATLQNSAAPARSNAIR